VLFLSDGTTTFSIGDVSAEELKRATCATLGFLFAQVLTVAELIRKIDLSTKPAAAGAQGFQQIAASSSNPR
jgi:hypothetical protein